MKCAFDDAYLRRRELLELDIETLGLLLLLLDLNSPFRRVCVCVRAVCVRVNACTRRAGTLAP